MLNTKTILFPIYDKIISPRLDYTRHFKLFTIQNRKVIKSELFEQFDKSPEEVLEFIKNIKPDVLICNGLPYVFLVQLDYYEIELHCWLSGKVDEILFEYLNGNIDRHKHFCIPEKESN